MCNSASSSAAAIFVLVGVFVSSCTGQQVAPDDTAKPPGLPVRDADGDGIARKDDCNDADPTVHPGADDPCDGIDQDCDGTTEDDHDVDGYRTCDGDCDDYSRDTYPGAEDPCDGVDRDCDGVVELDIDKDRFYTCEGDCDDTQPTVHPGAAEVCDGYDNDCDGVMLADEQDGDGDGYSACNDCDDTRSDVRPGGVERCGDGIDQDCDGTADVDCPDCTWIVPTDIATIQGAIDASADGDRICVAAGTWHERIDFGGRNLSLVGIWGREETTLNADRQGTVVSFVSGEGPDAVIDGFTIRGGFTWVGGGGGVKIQGSSPTLRNLTIRENLVHREGPWHGGGVMVVDGDPSFTNLRILRNEASRFSMFDREGQGGGVYLENAHVSMDNVDLRQNWAGTQGGGVFAVNSEVVFSRVRLHANLAYTGAGIYSESSTISITNAQLTRNRCYYYDENGSYIGSGGGVAASSSSVDVDAAIFAGNSGTLSSAFYGDNSHLQVRNSIFHVNYSGVPAVGLEGDSTGDIAFTDFWGNLSGTVVGMDEPVGVDGNTALDPRFGTTWHLEADSLLVDAGDPAVLDPDGSRSDIGMWGGAGAAGFDLDGDGYLAWWQPGPYDSVDGLDCDDTLTSLHPGSGC